MRVKQMWKCDACGTERQWGNIQMHVARSAARLNGETIIEKPVLECLTCKDVTPHVFAYNDVKWDYSDVAPETVAPGGEA